MRPITRGSVPQDKNGKDIQYQCYATARGELINRIGQYCSYCEMKLDSSLHIEHFMLKRLIAAFPGTAINCFDGSGATVHRPTGQI